jgi:hypothetical protein
MTASRSCLKRSLLAVLCSSCAGAGGEGGQVVALESRDVRVADAGPGGVQGYEYVARRALGVVALAEARGIDPPVARAAVDRLADALDTCATDEGRKGTLTDGAARVIAQIAPDGSVAQTTLRVDPGSGIMQKAIVCLVAPVKMLGFSAIDGGARAIAIEAIWGHVGSR